ncbi:carbohydrate-binding protein [Lutibacter citreus]|uniref:carbohydrate-binding protein n=1 Tax=Lutibacter citreus TaxID=2138210 RepID=UPI000DBE2019|nr:carbohydrate-binding protein [Lutibacter citreus]
MRVDSLFFDTNGMILKKDATLRGVEISKIDKPIQIDRYFKASKVRVSRLKDSNIVGWQLDYIEPNAFITYNSVGFKGANINKVIFRVASGVQGGTIKLYVGNELLGTVEVKNTGGWNNWKEVEIQVNKKIEGIQNIKLEFEGKDKYLMNIDWVKFE